MKITDIEFKEVLEKCLPIYIEEMDRNGRTFMCLVIKENESIGYFTGVSAIQRIEETIYPFETLFAFLRNKYGLTKNEGVPELAIQFYQDWIEELREKHEII